ncbi:MAG: glycosyltransferase family 9 protein, partial [Acidobacteriota bacterium]
MFRHLHITNRRERWLVGLADLALRVLAAAGRLVGAARPVERTPLRRILLLRLERVGDLLMVLDALAMVRELAPSAHIDLVVGRWNAALAGIIPGIDSVETLDAPWMARAWAGQSWPALLRYAWGWRRRRYDLAINFESDIRSNLLLWLSGSRRRVGFGSGGGGALLTDVVVADRTEHVAANASLVVARAFDQPAAATADVPGRKQRRKHRLDIPAAARQRATALLADVGDSERLVGLQPGAGRQLREWDPARFGAVATELARGGPVSFVLTGSAADAAALAGVTTTWPPDLRLIVLPVDTDLVVLAAVIERLSLFIT